jgi:succinate-semialdehyde dehydrogenase/glutarate-semialdehyde dehydrogenase
MGFTTIDPASGDELESFAYMPFAHVAARLDGARAAGREWRDATLETRGGLLREVARRLRAERESLAATATREMGKPIVQARAEVEKCAMCCDYFADNAATMLADLPIPSAASRSYVAFRPLGVVLAIMPWNYPYWQVFRAAAPALMAGNAIVLKHAENTTRCALEMERIFRDAGAPTDLFATILYSNEDTDALIADERIAAVTLTGSERAGIAVGSAAGAALKPSVLELGGSDAFVVRADADLDATAKAAVAARFQNNGQSCIAAKRFIVADAVYDAFLERFVAGAHALVVGDPATDATGLGPVARDDLRTTLHAQVSESVSAGARLALGGKNCDGAGFFYEATIVAEVAPGMRMFDQEVFGPAAAVIRARDDDHAIELANATAFGLGGSIWTLDVAEGERLAARLECGCAFVNAIVASDPRVPFGGIKRSGYGRELSTFGIHEFVNVQTVWVG